MYDNTMKALERLSDSVIASTLDDGEKNALLKLIKIIIIFYDNKYKEIEHNNRDGQEYLRLSKLTSIVTDYIVTINDTIKGKNDVFLIVNMIYKEINYDNSKGKFKRKRLI